MEVDLGLVGVVDSLNPPMFEVKGLSAVESKLMYLGLYAVIQSELLSHAECTHRAIGACIGKVLTPEQDTDFIMAYMGQMGIAGDIVYIDGYDCILLYGVNTWNGVDNPLSCKGVGSPWRLPHDELPWAEQAISGRSMIDQSCPKRTKGLDCNIQHAERNILQQFLMLNEHVNISTAEKKFYVLYLGTMSKLLESIS